MPELCRFEGIVIRMYWDDHPWPHFHATYSGVDAIVDIRTHSIQSRNLPPRIRRKIVDWSKSRERELLDAWDCMSRFETPSKIAPPR